MNWLSTLFKPKTILHTERNSKNGDLRHFFDSVRGDDIRDVRRHLEAGLDPNQKEIGGESYPIHCAAVKTKTEIMALLVQFGANVNVSGLEGRMPLHNAADLGCVDAVKFLIGVGANINAEDNFKHTPMFYAALGRRLIIVKQSDRDNVVALLKSHGARPSPEDVETSDAMVPYSDEFRLNFHMTRATECGDLAYHKVLREISCSYPLLHDGYRLLRNKADLSPNERVFVNSFDGYEKSMRLHHGAL